jgi:hypothetical protein
LPRGLEVGRLTLVPTISRFFGIVIRMYFDDHSNPHFHAIYGEDEAMLAIETLDVLDGKLPRRALSLVVEWAVVHRDELRDNWSRAERHEPLKPVAPLAE